MAGSLGILPGQVAGQNGTVIPNRQLRAAREATPSPYVAGACMSSAELAEAINRWVEANSSAHGALDEHYVGRLERGKVTWPGQHYRAGFRAVLGATTDADLGFFPSNRRPVTPLAAVLDDSEGSPRTKRTASPTWPAGRAGWTVPRSTRWPWCLPSSGGWRTPSALGRSSPRYAGG